MKVQEEKKELAQLSSQELIVRLVQARKDLAQTRINASTVHVKDNSQFKKMRKLIARTLTLLQQKIN